MDLIYAAVASPEATTPWWYNMVPLFMIMGIIYFLMIRPQAKRQKEKQNMLTTLKKGDHVVTIGGIHGVVGGFKNKNSLVVLKLDKNVSITVNKAAIAGLVGSTSEDDTMDLEAQA